MYYDKKILIVLMIFVFSGCDYDNILPLSVEKEISSIDVITTNVNVIVNNEIAEWQNEATAFHIGDGYMLALSHATRHPGYINIEIDQFRNMKLMVTLTNYSFTMNDKPIELIGRYKDISLFKTDEIKYTIPFGDSEKLQLGTNLVVLGNSFLSGINVKKGSVTMLELNEKHNITNKGFENEYKNSFLIDCPVLPGDSGSPE